MVRVLFVCLGNICRSPTAEGVLRTLVRARGLESEIEIDSAGTHAYHVGQPPDPRACAAAARRGIELHGLRARQTRIEDFHAFDYILCMDHENRAHLEQLAPTEYVHKIRLYMEFARAGEELEVPDPYYGGSKGFEQVLDMLEEAAAGLLEHLGKR